MTTPLVSVILPTCDGEAELARLLPALRAQVLAGEVEVRAVDSGSRDGSRELLRSFGAHVERIERAEFRHGRTRNACARGARGRFLVFLSQDIVPADERFLAHLIEAFDDPRVAGAYSRVLPHPDDDPLTARTVLDLPESSGAPSVRDLDRYAGVWAMDPGTRVSFLRFNNVASAIRAEVFRAIPFPDVAFAEDFAWAARALTAGHRIAFAPKSIVHHAHAYSLGAAFERYQVDALFHYRSHGLRVRPTLRSVLRGFLYEVSRDLAYLRRSRAGARARAALRSPALRAAQVVGQYLGSHGVEPRARAGAGRAGLHP